MNTSICLTSSLLDAINKLASINCGIEVERGSSGNSHTSTYIIIGVRHADEASYIHKLRIKHISGYHYFINYIAVSDEFGALCCGECSLDEIIAVIESNRDKWRDECKADVVAAAKRMAAV